ncbi:MAG: hypothetical protein CBC09_00715, partial [Cellvibrionales bacterium TMED49]
LSQLPFLVLLWEFAESKPSTLRVNPRLFVKPFHRLSARRQKDGRLRNDLLGSMVIENRPDALSS